MKICYVCGEYPPGPHGGVGTLTQMLARGFAASGHDVRVIGLCHPDYPGPAYEVDRGVQVWRYREPRFRGGWIVGRQRLFATIAAWSRAREIDLVEMPDWQGPAAGWPALPVPVVVRLSGSATYFAAELNRAPRRLTRVLERATLNRADFVCSVSAYTARRTRAVFHLDRDADAVLLNPVDLSVTGSHEPRSIHDVVFTGTLTAKKGVVSLMDAWPLVRQRCHDARLHIFGRDGTADDGSSMQAFLMARLAHDERSTVTFHGHADRDTLFGFLRRAGAAVFPSYAEAFAIAPLEAMACGCPTIISNRGAGTELLQHGREGLLVDPSDPPAIASAITSLLSDSGLALRLGEAGQRRVLEGLSLPRQLGENLTFYKACLERFDKSGPRSALAAFN